MTHWLPVRTLPPGATPSRSSLSSSPRPPIGGRSLGDIFNEVRRGHYHRGSTAKSRVGTSTAHPCKNRPRKGRPPRGLLRACRLIVQRPPHRIEHCLRSTPFRTKTGVLFGALIGRC